MKHYNRLNKLLLEYTVMSQRGNVPNLEKTEYTDLVNFCISNKNFEQGLKIVNSAMELFPSSFELILKKIEIFLLTKQPEKALNLLDKIEHLNRLSQQAQILKAKALKATGKDKDALNIIEGLEDSTKNDFDVFQLQASLLENLEQFEHLYHVTKEQILAAPKDKIDQLLEKFSFFTEITAKHSDAADFYPNVIDRHPFSSTAWQNLGRTHGFLGNCKDAVDAYEFCIAINAKSKTAYFGAAECLEKAERYDLAINYYNEYIDNTQQNDPDALTRIGYCFYNMDDMDAAKEWLHLALHTNPELPEAFFLLGIIEETTNPQEAINYYEEAIDIDPFNEDYIIALAQLHNALGNLETAKQFFQQAIDTAPDVIDTWIPYIKFLIQSGENQLLLENLEEVSTYFNQEQVIFLKIAGLFAIGKRKEAKYWLAEAMATYDESPELLFTISPELYHDLKVQEIIKKYRD